MKSAVSVLHEIMTKLQLTPIYECTSEYGKLHKPVFRYRCSAVGEVVTGTGRSKKEARQVVARLMLQALYRRGYTVPPEYRPSGPSSTNDMTRKEAVPERNFIKVLDEMCKDFGIREVEYEMSPDTGPRHHPRFTVTARLALVECHCTATSKKLAYQLAAEKIYKHLRTRLGTFARPYDEKLQIPRDSPTPTLTASLDSGEEMFTEFERFMADGKHKDTTEIAQHHEPDDTPVRRQAMKKKNNKKKRSQTVENATDVMEESIRLEIGQADLPNVQQSGISPDVAEEPADNGPPSAAAAAAAAALLFIERTIEKLGF